MLRAAPALRLRRAIGWREAAYARIHVRHHHAPVRSSPARRPGGDRLGGDYASGNTPQISAFDNENVLRDHMRISGNIKDLGKWGNHIYSMIILSGTRKFFDDGDFKRTKTDTLGPGMYSNISDEGIKDHSISSIRLASRATISTR
jgi:Beta/Gamma crystallin